MCLVMLTEQRILGNNPETRQRLSLALSQEGTRRAVGPDEQVPKEHTMKIDYRWQDVPSAPVVMEEVLGVTKRLAQGPADGVPTVALRVFTLEPGGHTPYHDHPFEHQNVVLEGQGVIRTPEGDRPIGPGTLALILPGETHQFRNTGAGPLSFVCVVPKEYA